MQDHDLIAMYFARNERAAAETERKFGGYCYTVAYNILGNAQDAEECVNDTLIRLWESIPPNQPKNLYAFIAAITRNIAKNKLKAAHVQRRGGSELPAVLDELRDCTDPDTVEQEIDRRALGKVLNTFLGTLRRDHRIIFVQRYWYLCSVDDIAENLHITKSKVTVTLMRTRKKLAAYLEKEGYS
ncbi:MAG: sigma-70 family RNA polymerase sigma factor [Oscillospiraceae bacterium]|nr:sigma-70 family RNA polymerase sigma factor [Oscillospiraceae bacterium]